MEKDNKHEEVLEEKKLKKEREKKQKNQRIPKEVSQDILKQIFKNLLIAIFIMAYFATLNLASIKVREDRLIGDLKVFAGVFLVVGIFFLEKAYKEDSGKPVILAIECIVMSIHTLTIMHVITMFKYNFMLYLLTSSYVISIYFVLKCIIIYTKGRREYLKQFSDIAEIVKKEEPIVREATKKNMEYKEEIKPKTVRKRVQKKKKNISEEIDKTKK